MLSTALSFSLLEIVELTCLNLVVLIISGPLGQGAYSGAALINFFLPKQSALEGIAYLRAAFIRVDRVRRHLLLFGILFI